MEFKNLLVPTDLSEASVEAFDLASYEAKMHGAKIHLVHILERSNYPLYTEIGFEELVQEYQAKEEALAREEISKFAEKYFHDLIVGVTIKVQENSVGQDLANYAQDNNCEGIIIASAGRGYLGRVLHGSTVSRVLEFAQCPVIVVPNSLKNETP